jgi:hypothetical protein
LVQLTLKINPAEEWVLSVTSLSVGVFIHMIVIINKKFWKELICLLSLQKAYTCTFPNVFGNDNSLPLRENV